MQYPDDNRDMAVRMAAFAFVAEQTRIHGEILTAELLRKGFDYQGARVPLMGPSGIFKPKALDLPLSITSVAPSVRRPGLDAGPFADLHLHRSRVYDPKSRGTSSPRPRLGVVDYTLLRDPAWRVLPDTSEKAEMGGQPGTTVRRRT